MAKKSPKQLYNKLFYNYTFIIVFIVLALMVYFISVTKGRVLLTNLDYMKMMSEKSVSYLEESSDIVDYVNSDLYQSTEIMRDLLQYLRVSDEDYQRYRLDKYMESSALSYSGFDNFIENTMRAYPNILSIDLISYDLAEVTKCYPEGRMKKTDDIQTKMKEIEKDDLAGIDSFAFMKEIRDPDTMQSVGCMIVHFKAAEFQKIQKYYAKAEMLVYNGARTVIFDSAGKYTPRELETAEEEGNSEEYAGAYVLRAVVKDYTVYALLDKQKADYLPTTLFLTILGIGTAVFLVGELLVHCYLRRLTKRLNYILDGMQVVTTGDLSIRLEADKNGDELDVISDNFNEMCVRLERYIQKSYLAEIEQKNAELEALQNQINPHFLYNTLESIRMKAICNGDREVGKMLYSMAVIFRSQLKEADIITVVQEIYYCKKYLELFEYRYQGKFTSEVVCPEELMKYPIIKFILQPIIENYFVHGIRAEQEGNKIVIKVEKGEETLLIHVTDNGRGMSNELLSEKNEMLAANSSGSKKSIGLHNVNRRIKAVYGSGYGVTLAHSESGGVCVTVKVGMGEKDANEKGYVN